jgi:hypothetical protein
VTTGNKEATAAALKAYPKISAIIASVQANAVHPEPPAQHRAADVAAAAAAAAAGCC